MNSRSCVRSPIIPAHTIGAAETNILGSAVMIGNAIYLAAKAIFLYGAGGTTAKFWIQTSLDGGTTWIDIMCFSFTTAAATKMSAVVAQTALAAAVTPTDGTLASDTILSGILGDRVRVRYTTTGTYTGATSIQIDLVAKG